MGTTAGWGGKGITLYYSIVCCLPKVHPGDKFVYTAYWYCSYISVFIRQIIFLVRILYIIGLSCSNPYLLSWRNVSDCLICLAGLKNSEMEAHYKKPSIQGDIICIIPTLLLLSWWAELIFWANIFWWVQVKNDDIKEMFSAAGFVWDVFIPQNSETG